MKTKFFLVINEKGSTKTLKSKPYLDFDEIAIQMELELPDNLFKKPQLSAIIKVDEKEVQQKVISPEIISNLENAIFENEGIKIKFIENEKHN